MGNGATCFLDDGAAQPTIFIWGDFDAVERLDKEINESIVYYNCNKALYGKGKKGAKGGYSDAFEHGKGKSGMKGPYGKGGMNGQHINGLMQDQQAWNAQHYGAWQMEGKGRGW